MDEERILIEGKVMVKVVVWNNGKEEIKLVNEYELYKLEEMINELYLIAIFLFFGGVEFLFIALFDILLTLFNKLLWFIMYIMWKVKIYKK